jgi:hypothetical protein
MVSVSHQRTQALPTADCVVPILGSHIGLGKACCSPSLQYFVQKLELLGNAVVLIPDAGACQGAGP